MLDSLKKFAVEHWLRHYRDPSSWAGLIVLVLTYFHIQSSPELLVLLEGILANLVGVLLLWMDGRVNPSIDPATGRIPPRVPTGVQPAADGTRSGVSTGSEPHDRPAESDQDPPGFNDNGPN